MLMHDGEQTGKFGEWLTAYLNQSTKRQGYTVYFDHGDKSWPNVGVIYGFYGDHLSRRNQLTQADVILVDQAGDIIFLIEIEERQSPPKKIIGDVFAVFMCNHFAVRHHNNQLVFRLTPETKFVFAGWASRKGSKVDQLQAVIVNRLQQFVVPHDSLNPQNIEFILEENLSSAIEKLGQRIVELLP